MQTVARFAPNLCPSRGAGQQAVLNRSSRLPLLSLWEYSLHVNVQINLLDLFVDNQLSHESLAACVSQSFPHFPLVAASERGVK